MSQDTAKPNSSRLVLLSGLALGAFSLLTMGLVLVFQFSTAERIRLSEESHRSAILQRVVAAAARDLTAELSFTPRTTVDGRLIGYEVWQGDSLVASIINTVTNEGYNGRIELLVGINPANEVTAVEVVTHGETPGLGDRIDKAKSPWLLQFDGRSLDNARWELQQQGGSFDSLSGATITSQAVVGAVQQALLAEQGVYFIDEQ